MDRGFAAKAFYFSYFATAAAIGPYLVLSYEMSGFSGNQIGTLTGLFPFATFIGIFFWSALADLLRRPGFLLRLLHGGALLGVLSLTQGTSYGALLVSVGLFAGCFGAIIPIVDSAVMERLEKKGRYGRYRVWGAVGYGCAAPLIGLMTERFGLQIAFWAASLFLLSSLLSANRLMGRGAAVSGGTPLGAYKLFDSRWLIFLSLAFTAGMAFAVSGSYVFLFLSQLGASRTVIGLSLTVATLSEVPFTLLGGRLSRRVAPPLLLLGALTLLGVRIFLYALTDSVAGAVAVQSLHGATVGIILIAGVAYADALAPPRLKATAQGLFGATLGGLGGAVGGLLGGQLYGHVGVPRMFTISAIGIWTVTLGVFILMRLTRQRLTPGPPPVKNADG